MQMMQGGGMGGMPGMGGMGGMPGAGGAGGMGGSMGGMGGMNPAMMQQFMNMQGGAGGAGGMAGGQASTQAPAERYANELSQLKEMGFTDEAQNLQVLQQCNGNVNMAIERLFASMGNQ